jgi:hypothetical protein
MIEHMMMKSDDLVGGFRVKRFQLLSKAFVVAFLATRALAQVLTSARGRDSGT